MIHDRHVDGLVQVGLANFAAIAISLSEVEAWLRVISLCLAIIYSAVMLVKALRKK